MRDVIRIFWGSKARFCWKHKTKQWKRFFLIKEKKLYIYNIYIYIYIYIYIHIYINIYACNKNKV